MVEITDYKCGHNSKMLIMSDNILEFIEYEEWRTSTGFDGDKSECVQCYFKRRKIEIDEFNKQWN